MKATSNTNNLKIDLSAMTLYQGRHEILKVLSNMFSARLHAVFILAWINAVYKNEFTTVWSAAK